MNRLATAQDQTHWSNVYTYDAWGNLSKKHYGAIAAGEYMDTSATTQNQLLGYGYDAGGNMTSDGLGGNYVYDGENRIASAGGVAYTYDADGRRVQKSSGTNYWYGPGGQVMAETDSAGNWTNYIFFAGQRLARNVPQTPPVQADIKYYITDHLHSTGIFADKSGSVLDDNDFYPWGGVVPGVGQTASNNTIKFTGQYRDGESQLDYFGARYYSNTISRFMSPDWAAKPVTVPYAKFGDPQTLNLYSYVENGPVNRIDPDGHSYVFEPFQDWSFDIGQALRANQTAQPQGQAQQQPSNNQSSNRSASQTQGSNQQLADAQRRDPSGEPLPPKIPKGGPVPTGKPQIKPGGFIVTCNGTITTVRFELLTDTSNAPPAGLDPKGVTATAEVGADSLFRLDGKPTASLTTFQFQQRIQTPKLDQGAKAESTMDVVIKGAYADNVNHKFSFSGTLALVCQ